MTKRTLAGQLGAFAMFSCVVLGLVTGQASEDYLKKDVTRTWEAVDNTKPSSKKVGWGDHQQAPKPIPMPENTYSKMKDWYYS
ncbi:hypothetical protein DIPPA_03993 [Diplonema papillatum]|nr:hypothetical protein DIPPA_03993 [Diplonema papillatum]